MQGRIHSFETFGTVDGPGTRFVVFVQGCPMRCLYCHNPDTWRTDGGKLVSVEEIMHEFDKKKEFYRKGGITVTGGEPLMQIDFVTELFEACKKKNIHTCLDSSGIMFNEANPQWMEKFDRLVKVTDLVMLDIKHIDDEEHKKLTSHSNKNILAFAKYLDQKKVETWIRHVVVPGITFKEEYLTRLGAFMAELHNIKALDVLPYHTMGIVKYENLGMDYPLKGVEPLSKADAVKAREIVLKEFKRCREEKKKLV